MTKNKTKEKKTIGEDIEVGTLVHCWWDVKWKLFSTFTTVENGVAIPQKIQYRITT